MMSGPAIGGGLFAVSMCTGNPMQQSHKEQTWSWLIFMLYFSLQIIGSWLSDEMSALCSI